MRDHATTNHTSRMVGHWQRTMHRPFKGHRNLRMAKNAYKCQTSAKNHGSLGLSKAFHPGLCSDCQTNYRTHEEGHPIRVDRRATTGTRDTYSEGHNCPSAGIPRLRATIRDGSGRLCLCSRSHPIPERRSGTKKRCWVLFKGIKPSRTKLRHLGSRVLGSHQSARQLATHTHWYPAQNHSMDRPCEPTVLLSTAESKQMSGQRNQLHGRVPSGAETHRWKEEQGRSTLQKA